MIGQILLTFALFTAPTPIETTQKMFATDTLEAVADLKWRQRVILIRTESQGDTAEALSELGDSAVEIDERHIYWFLFHEGQLQTNAPLPIGEQFADATEDEFFGSDTPNVVLIGKDGGVKDRSSSLRLNDLFALIDTMPMRRSEMGDPN